MEISKGYKNLLINLSKNESAASLASIRFLFGLIMAFSIVRFWYNGWIEKIYLDPGFHFTYFGFDWLPDPGRMIYVLFGIAFTAALFVSIGFLYRLSIIVFFFSFTYIELLEKTTYLNHYYFISVFSFILIFLPMDAGFSFSSYLRKENRMVPMWTILSLKILIAVVYFYAGLAKINTDWIVHAKPLSIWLSSKTSIPVIGKLMDETWVHYLFSWGGVVYDLGIVLLLASPKFRKFGFLFVLIFHLLTSLLFPIGMFPYIMIMATLIFFSVDSHKRIWMYIFSAFKDVKEISLTRRFNLQRNVVFTLLFIQLLLPLRSLGYSGDLFWHEQGYRFSWRVMLMEKTGYCTFTIERQDGSRFAVQNSHFLNSLQEKQMSTQPDFILEFAHFLGEHFERQGHGQVKVFVDSFVSINGKPSQRFVRKGIDLMTIHDGFHSVNWLEAYE